VHADAAQRITPEEFCSTVNVANPKSEPDAIRNAIKGCVDETQRWVCAPQSIPNDDWSACGLSTCNKSRKIGDAELAVTVGVGEVLISRSGKT
jgi:hypothetical protein